MALISPILDDRTYEQLREELVKRIPVYAPEWTDHNESDPGIALLELFAYLGESVLYRFNQIPDTTKIEFLRLLGVAPRTARPAQRAARGQHRARCGRASSTRHRGQGRIDLVPDHGRRAGVAARLRRRRQDRARRRRPPAPTNDRRYDAWRRMDLGLPRRRGDLLRHHRRAGRSARPRTPCRSTSAPRVDQTLWIALLRKDTTELSRC